MLMYNKDRIFAFVNALGDVGTEWGVAAAGCVNWGFPTLADTDIPGNPAHRYLHLRACGGQCAPRRDGAASSVEVRGLKVNGFRHRHSVSFGPAYEGERVRGADLYCQMGGGKTQCTELVKMADMKEIEDGKVEVIGPDVGDMKAGSTCRWAFMCRLPAANSRRISSRSSNARFTI
jgi:acetyl-CoA synthase